jgi:hypothetical protein
MKTSSRPSSFLSSSLSSCSSSRSMWAAAAAVAVLATAWPQAAHALLRDPVTSGLLASGQVDPDGFGPAPLSSQERSETAQPLTVSTVSVADAVAGSYEYRASADIGNLALKVFGSLSNGTGSVLGNGETPVMQVAAQVLDVITLQSANADPYDVTLELLVDGNIASAGAASASANAFIDFGLAGATNTADSARYGIGLIDDRLSVTKTVAGPIVQMDLEALLTFSVLTLDAGASVTGELSNTALLRLVLPPGVQVVNSASGTFGVPIPAVPEPTSWALMAGGLLAMGSAVWRRRRRSLDEN